MNILNPYSIIISAKNKLYDNDLLSLVKADVPVLSVGNLTTGGTGKTPFILYLVDLILNKNPMLKILVISKSYKTDLKESTAVQIQNPKASRVFGDEPVLIQRLRPEIQVWAGPSKSETLKKVLDLKKNSKMSFDLVLIDDGFSHRKIKRDLDFVLIDVSQPLSHYKLLPLGHLREDLSELKRCQMVILTKVSEADSKTYSFLQNYLTQHCIQYIHAEFESDLNTDSPINDILLFSGIGNPKQLEQQLRRKGFQIVHHEIYNDHYNYKDSDQNYIKQISQKHKQAALCTTMKDFVKLTNEELINKVKIINLKIFINKVDESTIYEKISQIF